MLQKENDIKQLVKTENRTNTNRKQNGYKKETEQVQTENRTDTTRKQNGYKQKTKWM